MNKIKPSTYMGQFALNIRSWARQRGLDKAEPSKQTLKLGEEYGELCAAICRNDEAETRDAIGDMLVVIHILCEQLGYNINECAHQAWEAIKDRQGAIVNGVYVKNEDLEDSGNESNRSAVSQQ